MREHAKLFSVPHDGDWRQVLVYLDRDGEGFIRIKFRLWSSVHEVALEMETEPSEEIVSQGSESWNSALLAQFQSLGREEVDFMLAETGALEQLAAAEIAGGETEG